MDNIERLILKANEALVSHWVLQPEWCRVSGLGLGSGVLELRVIKRRIGWLPTHLYLDPSNPDSPSLEIRQTVIER